MQGVNFDFCFLKHQLEAEQLSLLKFVPYYELWSVRRSGREKSLSPGQLPTVRLANTFNGEKYFPLFTHSISPSPKAHFLRRDFNRRSCGRLSIPVTNKADSRHKMRSIARKRKPHIRVTLALLLVNLTAKMTNIERVENAPRLWKWKFGLKVKVLGLSNAGGGKTRH